MNTIARIFSCDEPLLPVKQYRVQILVPGIFALILLLAFGARLSEPFEAVVTKLLAIAIPVAWYLFVQFYAKTVRIGHLVIKYAALSVLFAASALLFDLSPLQIIVIPLLLLMLPVVFLGSVKLVGILLSVESMVVLVLLPCMALVWDREEQYLAGVGLIWGGAGTVLLGLSWLRARSMHTPREVSVAESVSAVVRRELKELPEQLLTLQDAAHDELRSVSHFINNFVEDLLSRYEVTRADMEKRISEKELFEALHLVAQVVADQLRLQELYERGSVRLYPISAEQLISTIKEQLTILRVQFRGDEVLPPPQNLQGGVLAPQRELLGALLRRAVLTHYFVGGASAEIILDDDDFAVYLTVRSDSLPAVFERTLISALGVTFRASIVENSEVIEFHFTRDAQVHLPRAAVHPWMLVAEDNPQILTFYSMIARSVGLHAEVVHSMTHLEELLTRLGQPRVAIVDLHLGPEFSGVDLVTTLGERYGNDLPILVVTGDVISAEELPVHGSSVKILAKPLSRRTLFAELQRMVKIV